MIENLYDKSIISTKIRNIMKTMKGFRNIIVHRYSKIDDELAYTFTKENINDFGSIIRCVEDIIDKY